MAVNLPGVNARYGLIATGLIGPFRREGTLTGERYLRMFNDSILPAIHQLYANQSPYYQQDGTTAQCHRDVKAYLD